MNAEFYHEPEKVIYHLSHGQALIQAGTTFGHTNSQKLLIYYLTFKVHVVIDIIAIFFENKLLSTSFKLF